MRRLLTALVAAAVALPGAPRASHARLPDRPNLLIVCVNCMNKSRLPLYGGPAGATPVLDALAEKAWVFDRAASPSTVTPPALRELLTARLNDHAYFAAQHNRLWDRAKTYNEGPIGAALTSLGYTFGGDLAALPPEPFFVFFHPTRLHYPYDVLFFNEGSLDGAVKDRYRRALEQATRFRTVEGPRPPMDPFLLFGFGLQAGQFPLDNPDVRKDFMAAAGEAPDSPRRRVLEAALGLKFLDRLKKRPRRADMLRVAEAINAAIARRDPVFERIFEDARIQGQRANFVFHGKPVRNRSPLWLTVLIAQKKGLLVPGQGALLRVGPPRAPGDEARLELLYRHMIESLFPSLAENQVLAAVHAAMPDVVERWASTPDFAVEVALLKALYDANVRDFDAGIGSALEPLQKSAAWDRTVFVFMGDHGEAFMERGRIEHTFALCDESVVSPPLFIRVPGALQKQVRIGETIRHVDVLPTLLDLMGLPWRKKLSGAVDGASFAPRLTGGKAAPAVGDVFSRNVLDAFAVRSPDGWKLVLDIARDEVALYDLNRDPGETRDLSREHPDVTARLEEKLRAYAAAARAAGEPR